MTTTQVLQSARKAILATEPRRDCCIHDDWQRVMDEIDNELEKNR